MRDDKPLQMHGQNGGRRGRDSMLGNEHSALPRQAEFVLGWHLFLSEPILFMERFTAMSGLRLLSVAEQVAAHLRTLGVLGT